MNFLKVILNFAGAVLWRLALLLIVFIPASNQLITGQKLIAADRFERDENLQAEADALLPLFDNMPPVAVYLKDELIIKSGTNTERGVAYTNCERNELPSISIKKPFIKTPIAFNSPIFSNMN